MQRRQVLLGTVGIMPTLSGCYDPERERSVEVYEVDEPHINAKIAEYDCIRRSRMLKNIVDEAIEEGQARMVISRNEEEEIRSVLDDCYDSEEGKAYIRHNDTLYKINFVIDQ